MRYINIILMLSFILSGCATTSTTDVITTTPMPTPYVSGIYHTVLKGQTLWRIAKAYDIDIKDIAEVNGIINPSQITEGQMILIPGAKNSVEADVVMSAQEVSKKGYVWPIKGRVISYFGAKKDSVNNKGVDIEADIGQAVLASKAGKVVFCDDKVKGLGKAIIIEHNDGCATLYAYNSVNLVKCGDLVKQSQPIAEAGNTGRAKRTCLHFQIRKEHKPQNPFYYLP